MIPLIVTAKHVIGDHTEIFGRFSPTAGSKPVVAMYDLDFSKAHADYWVHPDDGVDLVIFRTLHFQEMKYQAVPTNLIASKSVLASEGIGVTDRIVFPSMLWNFMGQSRNYPVMRDGSIASMPDEPVPMEYKVGSRTVRTDQELVFIDATAMPGASGAPLFLWPGPRLRQGAFVLGGTRAWLVGILHGFYPA